MISQNPLLHDANTPCDRTIHTNTIEGYFSIFKRGMRGIYQHCSERQLRGSLGMAFTFTFDTSAIEPDILDRAHRAIGKATAHWQYVETALFVLMHCLAKTSYENSSAVFFDIKNNQNHLTIIDKLCLLNLSQRDYGDDWKKMRKGLKHLIDLRNAVAHFEMSGLDLAKFPSDPPTQFGIIISPNQFDVIAAHSGRVKLLYLEQIELLPEDFDAMAQAVTTFIEACVPDWQRHAELLPLNPVRALGRGGKTNSPSKL